MENINWTAKSVIQKCYTERGKSDASAQLYGENTGSLWKESWISGVCTFGPGEGGGEGGDALSRVPPPQIFAQDKNIFVYEAFCTEAPV